MIELFKPEDRINILEDLLDNEPLFNCLCNRFANIDIALSEKKTNKEENWVDAKQFVVRLLERKYPDKIFDIVAKQLFEGCRTFCSADRLSDNYLSTCYIDNLSIQAHTTEYEIVILYATLIVFYLSLTDNCDKYEKILAVLMKHSPYFTEKRLGSELITVIEENVDNGNIPDVYDYTKENGTKAEAPTQQEIADTQEPDDDADETATIIYGKKGQEKMHRITAQQISEIVAEYNDLVHIKKDYWIDICHKLTGIKRSTLRDAIRVRE